MHNRQWKEAAEAFSEIIRDDPEDGEGLSATGRCAVAVGAVEDALADAERAVWLLPDDSDSYLVRGRARLRRQSYAGAIADFTRYLAEEDSLAASPAQIAGVYYLRGVAHADNGDSGGGESPTSQSRFGVGRIRRRSTERGRRSMSGWESSTRPVPTAKKRPVAASRLRPRSRVVSRRSRTDRRLDRVERPAASARPAR